MSIIGLTDQAAALPVIGTLRKGEKKVDENKPGKDLTYFRFVSDDALANQMFSAAYPDQEAMRTINIFLPYKTAKENFDAWVEEWVAGGLMHRCDGQTQVLWRTPAGGYSTTPRPCENCRGKQVGRLSVVIPELGRFDTVTVLTTSIHDIIKLSKQLAAYEALSGGELRGVPFTLRRRKETVSTPGPKGTRLRREKWLLSIETQPRWSIAKLTALEHAALPSASIYDGSEIDEPLALAPGVPNVSNPFDEADFEPVESVATAPQTEQPKPANGNGGRALMEPATLKAKLTEMVERSALRDPETKELLPGSMHPLGEKMPNLISKLFRLVFEDSHDEDESEAEKMYHTSLQWLTGVDSANRLNAAAIDALLYWLVGKDNKKAMDSKAMEIKAAFRLVPSDTVIEEAYRVHREALKDAGQADMFEPAPTTEQDELPL